MRRYGFYNVAYDEWAYLGYYRAHQNNTRLVRAPDGVLGMYTVFAGDLGEAFKEFTHRAIQVRSHANAADDTDEQRFWQEDKFVMVPVYIEPLEVDWDESNHFSYWDYVDYLEAKHREIYS